MKDTNPINSDHDFFDCANKQVLSVRMEGTSVKLVSPNAEYIGDFRYIILWDVFFLLTLKPSLHYPLTSLPL